VASTLSTCGAGDESDSAFELSCHELLLLSSSSPAEWWNAGADGTGPTAPVVSVGLHQYWVAPASTVSSVDVM
jgi:hypothetical protein